MKRLLLFFTFCLFFVLKVNAQEALPFSQDWTNPALITMDDNWSGVAGIIGYRGDGLTGSTGTDPQTILVDGTATPVDIIANQGSTTGIATGGNIELDGLVNPTVAFQGSGTANAPFLLISVNTTNFTGITVQYNLRELDADNSIQQVALHYRVGSSGNFTNVAAGYVADASNGSAQVTPINVVLPVAAENQSEVQIRILTTNAAGVDSLIGIDDISVTGTPPPPNVPTLSQWGLIILALMFMTLGTLYISQAKVSFEE
ncbi:MAG: IPTL-CTERM sorting domain-containing protein [Chitinophagales bacterium]